MKKLFANLSLRWKIMIAPSVVLLFLLILGWISYGGLVNQKAAIEDIFNNRFKSYQASATILKDMANVHSNLYKTISWAGANYEAAKIESLTKEQLAIMEKTQQAMERALQASAATPEEKKLFQQTSAQLLEYKKSAFAAMDLASSDLNMATMYMSTADDRFQVLNRSLHNLLDLETKFSKESYESSVASFAAFLRNYFVVMAVAVLLSILVSLLISGIILKPIREAIYSLQKVADGDLTQKVNLVSKDEVGDLAEAVNTMCQKMGEAVGHSMTTSQSLAEAASQQAAALEETSSSLEEMSSMTKQNAGSAEQANRLMREAQGVIEGTNHSMNDLTNSMKEIAKASEQTQKIVKTIDEVAFQTNLLALNAAVEAARAGEAGAGFAVVADEVRNLAMRAAEAAKNTSGLMDDIVRKIKNGEKLVGSTDESFKKVTDSSKKVVNLVGEIAGATQEQSQGIDQINKAMAEMNTVTQKNAASAQELASIMANFKTNEVSRTEISTA